MHSFFMQHQVIWRCIANGRGFQVSTDTYRVPAQLYPTATEQSALLVEYMRQYEAGTLTESERKVSQPGSGL
jgi:hypothetical protein